MKHLLSITIIGLLLFSCQPEKNKAESKLIQQEEITDNKLSLDSTNLSILLFKLEKKLECWVTKNGVQQKLIDLPVEAHYFCPIGVFDFVPKETSEKLTFKFPNSWYQKKVKPKDLKDKENGLFFSQLKDENSVIISANTYQELERLLKINSNPILYIFPNDSRKKGKFIGDFAAPNWMSALYSTMDLHLKTFNQEVR